MRKVTFLTIVTGVLVFFSSPSLWSNPGSPKTSSIISSSRNCKECHVEIYNHWKNAMHSMSLEDPIFKVSYLEAYFKTGGEIKYHCLRCHAPVTLINSDYDLKNNITQEGVTCDFCHSIKKINLNNKKNPFELDPGEVKRGPLSKVVSPAHKTEPSPLFKSSELCAGCHEFINDKGVTVLGTYSEWKASPYAAKETPCQSCHMPLISGKVVKSNIKSSNQKKINLHAISASHSTEYLRKAIKVKIKNIYKENDIIEVIVGVTNSGSGHQVPTGIPSRKLILTVEMRTPNEYLSQQRIYEKIMLDEEGKEIKKEYDAFTKAAKVSFDNRIRPMETRLERFAFARPKHKSFRIIARVDYLYKTVVLSPTEMRVKMAEDTRSIK